MNRTLRVGLVVLVVAACHHQAPHTAVAKAAPRVQMDSAEIERLCAHPDSVRAGVADCVLKDQAPPPQQRLKPVPASPPR